jgi:hypothetical protein
LETTPASDGDDEPLLLLGLPPILNHCQSVLTRDDDRRARNLYWSVVSESIDSDLWIATLQASHEANPFIYEPLVLMGQLYLQQSDFANAIQVTQQALQLQLEWGTNWDKRKSFPAWVAWTRVLNQRSVDQEAWPTNAWEVLNLGLVH